MIPQIAQSRHSNLGLLTNIDTPSATAITATGTGTCNKVITTTPVKFVTGRTDPVGNKRNCRLCVPSSSNHVAIALVRTGATAPAHTAVGDGTATDGLMVMNGGGIVVEFSISDDVDLYVVASAATTPVNLRVDRG